MIAQIMAVTIFVIKFLLIVSEKIERHIVTMGCGVFILIFVFGICMRSPEAIWATLNFQGILKPEFWYLAGMAEEGKSFVIVGRCAETILKDFPGLISIFILGDYETKLQRIMEKHNVSAEEAKQLIKRGDWKRKAYHNYYCKGKWGDSRNYDISVNSSKLGIEKTTDMLENYIKERMNMN